MGLAKLINEAQAEPIRAGNITFRLSETMILELDSLASEIGVSRSSVIRESLAIGVAKIRADWERTQDNAAKRKGGK